jgi:hypothetical protein
MIVPFGKYKDKDYSELLNDKKYYEWCIKEKIFNQYKSKNPHFYELVTKKTQQNKVIEENQQLLYLGALIENTNIYVLTTSANKNNVHMCPDCGDKLILKKGDIRIPHFSHYKKDNSCSYYTHPNESQIHKDAKLLLKYLLENKKVCIKQDCTKCNIKKNIDIIKTDNVKVELEYKFIFNEKQKFADIGYIQDGNLKYIFEIYNTHLTNESDRPEHWFEINAKILMDGYKNESENIIINCIRKKICDSCIESNKKLFVDAKEKLVKYLDHRVCNRSGAWMDYPIINHEQSPNLLDELLYEDKVLTEDEYYNNKILTTVKQFHDDWIPTYETCEKFGYKLIIIADIIIPYKGLVWEIWFLDDGSRTDINEKINDIIKYNKNIPIYSINPNVVMTLYNIDFNNYEKCKKMYDYIIKKSKLLYK